MSKLLYSALKYEKASGAGTKGRFVNIGDWVQTLAALQYLPTIDGYIERGESSKDAHKLQPSFCIKNGWYDSYMLPPSSVNVHPFYISVHISDPQKCSQEAINHLKDHGPIGCRDASTLTFLQDQGVSAYYSGCLTLSLPASKQKRTDQVYLVDLDDHGMNLVPEEIKRNSKSVYYATSRSLFHLLKSDRGKFVKPFPGVKERLGELIELPSALLEDRFRSFSPSTWTECEIANLLHLLKASSLLKLYGTAKLVITSRLHCAAPCIALGTPVVFIPKQRFAAGDSRFETIERYLPVHYNTPSAEINWSPEAVNIDAHKAFLRMICRKAIELQDNPLKETSLEYFQQQSGWYPG